MSDIILLEDVKKMKKVLLLISLLVFILLPKNVYASNKVTIYFFRGATCSHCEEALEYINNHKDEIDEDIEIITYEVWENANNENLHQAVVEKLDVPDSSKNSVPFIVIGDIYQIGMNGNKTDFDKILNMARAYVEDENYTDVVKEVLNENKFEVKALSLDELYSEPNKVVTIVVYSIFGIIVLGIGAMIIFSRK